MPVIYVDVDDTLVRSFGSKRMPMGHMVTLVRTLKEAGVELYCWSSGGAAYAKSSADDVRLTDCFTAFLPKPHLLPAPGTTFGRFDRIRKILTQCGEWVAAAP